MSWVAGAGSTRGSTASLAVLVLVVLATGLGADVDDGDPLARSAESFCRLFIDGEYEQIQALMSAEMQAALTPDVSEKIRNSLTGPNGALQGLGQAWKEDEVQGFVRYRVPAEFEKRMLDLRVVFDGEGKVAGFFQVPHLERPTTAAQPNPAIEGHWEGSIEIPGSPLPVEVDLSFAEGAWSGTFASPMQGARGLPLDGIRVEKNTLRFSIAGIPGNPTFEGRLEEAELRGTFSQSGQSFPLRLGREEVALPARPQEPTRPFPYLEEDILYSNGEIDIACTLTRPKEDGPFAAAMLLTGSGAQNRDEELLGHKPFLVLSDHLTRAGMAVLRCDDRGVGGTTGDLATSTLDDLAADALAGVRFLAGRKEIDAERIGLIGHSEGGIVAPLVASGSDQVAFVVMLAGTGVPGDEILVRQLELLLRASGTSEEKIEAALAAHRELLGLAAEGAPEDKLLEPSRKLTEIQVGSAELDAGSLDELASAGAKGLTTPWFRSFLSHDPRLALKKIRVPVLALNGELDLQVDPEQNLPQIRAALQAAGNEDGTAKQLPGLNHLFQPAQTGAIGEYAAIEETIDPSVLELISGWILDRFTAPQLRP